MPLLSETDLLHMLIERAPYAIPGIHIERRNIINVQAKAGFRVRNGVKGQADAFAVYRGLHLEIETKAARGSMREAQERWRERCLTPPMGGPQLCPHLVLRARPDEHPGVTVERWVSELCKAIQEAAHG